MVSWVGMPVRSGDDSRGAGRPVRSPDRAARPRPEPQQSGHPDLSYVPSPTELLPDVRFTPVPKRPEPPRPGLLERVPGRHLFLVLILIGSIPLAWSWFQPEPDPIVPARVIDEPPVMLVVTSTGVEVSGIVSSVQMHELVMDRLEEVLGPDAVADGLTVDESVIVDLSLPTPIELGDDVRFPVGQSEILAPYEPLIETAARMLLADLALSLAVVGHTDSTGPDESNLRLSVERAEAVRAALLAEGVLPEQVRADGRGEDEPIASNDDPEGRAQNRRVEFEVIGLLG